MHQAPHPSRAARIGQRSRRDVVHFVVCFSATLAQNADAVHDHIDTRQQRPPSISSQQLFEPDRAAFAAIRLNRKTTRRTIRIAAADDDVMPAIEQRGNGVASYEAGAAQYQDAHLRS